MTRGCRSPDDDEFVWQEGTVKRGSAGSTSGTHLRAHLAMELASRGGGGGCSGRRGPIGGQKGRLRHFGGIDWLRDNQHGGRCRRTGTIRRAMGPLGTRTREDRGGSGCSGSAARLLAPATAAGGRGSSGTYLAIFEACNTQDNTTNH